MTQPHSGCSQLRMPALHTYVPSFPAGDVSLSYVDATTGSVLGGEAHVTGAGPARLAPGSTLPVVKAVIMGVFQMRGGNDGFRCARGAAGTVLLDGGGGSAALWEWCVGMCTRGAAFTRVARTHARAQVAAGVERRAHQPGAAGRGRVGA